MELRGARWVAAGAVALTAALGVAHAGRGRGARVAAPDAPLPADTVALARTAQARCTEQPRPACYEALLARVAAERGPAPAMGALRALGRLDGGVSEEGHALAHAVGIAAGRASTDMARTFADCSELYQSGCYHGVIQAYFERVPRADSVTVNALCRAYGGEGGARWLRFQCVHGMGHGLTTLYGHDLPRALAGCDLLTTDWDRESCYGGAFMENFVHATGAHHHASTDSASRFRALDPADPQYPCSALPARYLDACYLMQPSVMLHLDRGDFAAAGRACAAAPAGVRASCYLGLGRDANAYARQDHALAARLCSLGDARYRPWCYAGVARNLVDVTARPDDGLAFCPASPDGADRAACYRAVGREIAMLVRDEAGREALCARAEPAYRDACRAGARDRANHTQESTR